MRRVLIAIAVLIAVGLGASACAIGQGGTDVDLTTTLTQFYKQVPGGDLPWIRAVSHAVIHNPPRGGTATVVLQFRKNLLSRWQFAGRRYFTNPWHVSTKTAEIEYVCLYQNSWWRVKYSWDAILADGQPDHGTGYYPSGRGARFGCKFIPAPAPVNVPEHAIGK